MPVVGDTRDLRDPQHIGGKLLDEAPHVRSAYGDKIPLSEIYDVHVGKMAFENVSADDSMGKQCVREYRAELEARKEEGDKYAEAALRDIAAGKGVQGYDTAGQ